MDKMDNPTDHAVSLQNVKTGVNYAMLISTNAGLWRYLIGDTVTFTETDPYRIKITGRTKHFINAFGEEVMVDNTEQALSRTCQEMQVKIRDYTVAPIYLNTTHKGRHEWLIEFDGVVPNLDNFSAVLDDHLQQINSDYEAKRYEDMAMQRLTIRSLPKDTFARWLLRKKKVGAQIKVPRLSNNREMVEEILQMLPKHEGVRSNP